MVIPIEAVRTGMGYDEAGRWHQARVRYMPAREVDDPLQSARGVVNGLLVSAALWMGLLVIAHFLFHLWW